MPALPRAIPYIVEQFRKRRLEIAGHGHAVTNIISSHMAVAEERAYIRSAVEALQRAGAERPVGWHGPEYGQSERTPALLTELGFGYMLDWPNDEQRS
jgi:allantoinase